MEKIFLGVLCIGMLSSCAIVTAPTSIAFRSNTNHQTAELEGKIWNTEQSPSVTADKTLEADSAVSTSSGSATTGDKSEKSPSNE